MHRDQLLPDSGWSITDWLEALVLRLGGPELYDRWAHRLGPPPLDEQTFVATDS